MKIFKLNLKRLPILALGIALFASCVKEADFDDPSGGGELTLTVQVPASAIVTTRSTTVGSKTENKISDVWVLFFNTSGVLKGKAEGTNLTPSGTNDSKWTFKVKTDLAGTFDVVVIANASDKVSGVTIEQNKNTVAKALNYTTSKWDLSASNPIPMWGELRTNVVAKTLISGIKLMRMVARINVDASKPAADSKFEMTSIRYYNYNTKGFVIPASVTDDKVSAVTTYGETMVLGTSALEFSGTTNISGYKCTDKIYVFETAKKVAADDTGWVENPCLVIGGRYYNGTSWTEENYYRIDFVKQENDKNVWMDVLRNHSYNITVKAVNGPGYGTPEEASISMPINMETDVIPWDDSQVIDVVSDGQYSLGVNRKSFEFFKDGASGETEENKLIVSTSYESNWTVSVVDKDGNPLNDWLKIRKKGDSSDLASITCSGAVQQEFYLQMGEYTGSAPQIAYILITAGKMSQKIEVKQNHQEKIQNYEISIRTKNSQGEWVEVSELFFIGAASDTPDPASDEFTVTWSPAGRELKATLIPGSKPLAGTINPFDAINSQSTIYHTGGKQEYAVSPTPIGSDGDGQAFFEKSAQVLFELATPTGPITKAINLRQTNYNLILMPGTLLMDGTEQEFRVQANFPWQVKKAEVTDAWDSAGDDFTNKGEIIKSPAVGQQGGNNTTTGDPVKLTCANYITTEYSSTNPTKAIISVEFERLEKGEWVKWGTYEVTCYAAVPVGKSNCYMIKNTEPVPILIPTSQIGHAIGVNTTPESGFLPSNWITNASQLKVQVLWSDVGAFEGEEAAVVKAVAYNGAPDIKDGKIVVVPGSGAGNSLIILYEDNDGTPGYQYKANPTASDDLIKWSWHIWKSDYYPYDKNGTPNGKITGNQSLSNTNWMDRNLGARTNTYIANPNAHHVTGFMYQWGRKDPLPSNSQWSTTFSNYLYYASGSGVIFRELLRPNQENNISSSVLNPSMRYWHGDLNDWYTTSRGGQNHDLWGGIGNSGFIVNSTSKKSVYDPCPEGYRVSQYGDWAGSAGSGGWLSSVATSGPNQYGQYNANYGGYYPVAGSWSYFATGLSYVAERGFYWSAGTYDNSGVYYMGQSLAFYNDIVSTSSRTGQSGGLPVRCRAE